MTNNQRAVMETIGDIYKSTSNGDESLLIEGEYWDTFITPVEDGYLVEERLPEQEPEVFTIPSGPNEFKDIKEAIGPA